MAVITVARQIGSRGDELARRVSDLLNYDLVDKNLISEVARVANVPETEVVKFDEKGEGRIKSFLKNLFVPKTSVPYWGVGIPFDVPLTAMFSDEIEFAENMRYLDQEECLKFFRFTIESLWNRGKVVIVGRAGQVILGNKEGTFHVRTMGSEELRCSNLMEDMGCDRNSAMEMIRNSDKQRANYLKQCYKVDWNNPLLYHLIINIEKTGLDLATRLVVEGAKNLE